MSRPFNTRIVVGLSGGVDSSVAALVLKRRGYDVHGLFMTNWEEDEEGYCTAARDSQDARQVCAELDIPLHRVNFAREYRERVFEYFLREYRAGRTPNPDVLCNREIKFGVFYRYARRLGADYVATGHYAGIHRENALCRLLKGADPEKDQSYFLHVLEQEVMARTVFPVGELNKPEVRALAREHGFDNFAKKDSTGICFIGERHFRSFLARYLPARPGDIRTPRGRCVGRHQGLMYYTLGQRRGLGIGGRPDATGLPWYVAGKDLETNTLIVVEGEDHPLLQQDWLEAQQVHWIAGSPVLPLTCRAKVRYRQTEQPCEVEACGPDRYRVTFTQPQHAVTPGQFVVFYLGEECLGGGVIEAAGSSRQAERGTLTAAG